MRFAMTARTLLRQREEGVAMNEMTAVNVGKVTRFREGGEEDLEAEVARLEQMKRKGLLGGPRGEDEYVDQEQEVERDRRRKRERQFRDARRKWGEPAWKVANEEFD